MNRAKQAGYREQLDWIKAERRDCGCTDRILARLGMPALPVPLPTSREGTRI